MKYEVKVGVNLHGVTSLGSLPAGQAPSGKEAGAGFISPHFIESPH